MYRLKIITSTVRDERQGGIVAEWVKKQAEKLGYFDIQLIDLGDLDLPLCKEPYHPIQKRYIYDTTKKWSKIVDEADAFIFVLAEYNHSYPAPLKNALDTVTQEWGYKPGALVSYGGISGGVRATNDLNNVLTTLCMVPILDSVIFPFYNNLFNEDTGYFEPNEKHEKSALAMLKELHLWTKGLISIREEKQN